MKPSSILLHHGIHTCCNFADVRLENTCIQTISHLRGAANTIDIVSASMANSDPEAYQRSSLVKNLCCLVTDSR